MKKFKSYIKFTDTFNIDVSSKLYVSEGFG